MNKMIVVIAMLLTGKLAAIATEPNISGVWLVGDKDYKIELKRTASGEIEGRVVWMKEPNDKNGKPRTDVDNDNPALRNVPVMGLKTVYNFRWDEASGEFINGNVYKKGTVYCGKMKLNPDGTLHLRGYVCKIKFIGKSDTWIRVK
ncbi:MAG TPA: DUF2147 domain-containing protein [Chitinophagales bacterium]|nr:DUF2147 domain-containing protein [Chitinophagales bacterium]